MELPVESLALDVIIARLLERLGEPPQGVDLDGRCVLRGQPGGAPLQQFADRIELDDLRAGQSRDDHASTGRQTEQAARLHPVQSLANRCPADVEPFRDLILANAFALAKAPLPDG